MNKRTLLPACLIALFAWHSQGSAAPDPWAESYRLASLGNYAGAAAQLDGFVRQDNEFAMLRNAYMLYMQGRFKDSVAAYQRVLELNPDSIDALLGIVTPLMAQLKWSEATGYANKVLDMSKWHYTAHAQLLVIQEAEKKWKDLADHAKALSKRYPSDATTWVYLARAHAWLGNVPAAVEAYRQVLPIVPGHIEATKYIEVKAPK